MSRVSSVILTAELPDNVFFADPTGADRPAIKEINEWLIKWDYGSLREVSDHCGGKKAFQHCVWLGAFNFLDETAFVQTVVQAFHNAGPYQLFVKREEESLFKQVAGSSAFDY